MENLIDLHNGPMAVAAMLCLHFLLRLGHFAWDIIKEKRAVSEQGIAKLTEALLANTASVQKLENRLNQIEVELSEIPKFKLDLSRAFVAIKAIAGADWDGIRERIMHMERDDDPAN